MRLLMLGWELPPYNSGGLGVACYQMAKALNNRGVDIDFVLPSTEDYSEIDFMKVHTVKADKKSEPKRKIFKGNSHTNPYTNDHSLVRHIQKNYIKYVEKLVADNNYDTIHAHDWLTMEIGVRAKEISGKPLIVQVHATEFDRAGGGRGNPLIHEIEEQGLLMADRIIAVSKLTKNMIVKKYHIPANKIEVIHNSIDIAELDKTIIKNEYYDYLRFMKNRGYKIVSTLGRLTVQKGLSFFLEAAKKTIDLYPKVLFMVAGDGEQRDELFELAAKHGIVDKVIFTGFVRGAQLRELYAITDIFVMSSVSEPFGLTALEAAAHNDALILTKTSGVAERLRNVLLYDFWDTNKLADDIINLAISPALLSSMQEEARNEFSDYSWDSAAELFEREYGRAMKRAAYA